MNKDQNPEAAPAENPAQTNLNSGVALPGPEPQSPPPPAEQEKEQETPGTQGKTQALPPIPAGGEQDQEHDQEQETLPAPVERQQAEAPSASQRETEGGEAMPSPPTAVPPPAAQAPPAGREQDQEQEGKVKPAKPDAIVLSSVLGTLDALSEAEQAEFFACEQVVDSGWQGLAQVGLALARIRDGRLYRMEFDSFQAYCQAKWEYGRRYVDQIISAAQVFTQLRAICSHSQPERESQVRPLIGLTPEQAQSAWERAVQKAGGGKITARRVKKAV